ncbi:hypothetical protein ACFFUP_18635 [Vibrio ostreicida]|uniref:Uncharacterized protein n=1 Tax=Vibrio ostreicida TaxID=526588 RepID=A0ABT8BQ41_9VIBR|nr:hypothetical protein [Vibrio ostreicida]MDN3608848.1 hypothetical protein [Vibrio ostreicida]NPD09882.1 hypothetical protein [Vibrio ostreicida]
MITYRPESKGDRQIKGNTGAPKISRHTEGKKEAIRYENDTTQDKFSNGGLTRDND